MERPAVDFRRAEALDGGSGYEHALSPFLQPISRGQLRGIVPRRQTHDVRSQMGCPSSHCVDGSIQASALAQHTEGVDQGEIVDTFTRRVRHVKHPDLVLLCFTPSPWTDFFRTLGGFESPITVGVGRQLVNPRVLFDGEPVSSSLV